MGILLGIIIVILGIIVAGITHWAFENKKQALGGVLTGLTLTMLIAFIFIPFGFTKLNSGEAAVVKVWGNATEVKNEGLHFRNIISTEYIKYDLKVQTIEQNFEVYTKDNQAITVKMIIQVKLHRDKLIETYKTFGSYTAIESNIKTLGETITEDVFIGVMIDDITSELVDIKQEVKDKLTLALDNYYLDIHNVTLTGIMYTDAFETEKEILKLKEMQLARQLAEAVNRVLMAEQEAEEKLARAKGEADVLREITEAEAQKIELLAKAEAESLRLKSIELARSLGINILVDLEGKETIDSTDPNINQLSAYLQYIAYLEAWDGELPKVVTDGSIIIPMP